MRTPGLPFSIPLPVRMARHGEAGQEAAPLLAAPGRALHHRRRRFRRTVKGMDTSDRASIVGKGAGSSWLGGCQRRFAARSPPMQVGHRAGISRRDVRGRLR